MTSRSQQNNAATRQKRIAELSELLLQKPLEGTTCHGARLMERGVLYWSERRWMSALLDLEEASLFTPLDTTATLALGDCFSRVGPKGLVETTLKPLIGSGSHNQPLYAVIYAAFKRIGRADLMLLTCRAAVQADPAEPAAHFALAHALTSLSYPATTIVAVLQRAVALDPENVTYRLSLAIQWAREGNNKLAYQELQRASVEMLRYLDCAHSIKHLLSATLAAKDWERAGALTEALRQCDPSHDAHPEGQA